MNRFYKCITANFSDVKSIVFKPTVYHNLKAGYCQKNIVVTESDIINKLKQKFPAAKAILVQDTSGGCGAMFNITIETREFKDLSIMKQHRLVYDTLKEQIENIHGLHLETRAPK